MFFNSGDTNSITSNEEDEPIYTGSPKDMESGNQVTPVNDYEEVNKEKIIDSTDTFEGIAAHKDILKRLLSEILPVNFADVIKLEVGQQLRQKHILVAVVDVLLDTAKTRKWNLCRAADGNVYLYNGAFWKSFSKDDLRGFLKEAAIRMGLADYEAKSYEFADKLLKQFLSDAHLPTREQDTNEVLINLKNGTFEFTSDGWHQREFNPDDFLTYQLPFAFEPNTTCPMFDKYLLRVLPDESSRRVLQEFSGFIFTKLNIEKFLVLTGGGGNGKSVFMNILCSLIGKENVLQYSLGAFSHEYNRAKLTNILLNYSSEKGFDLNPDIFKALISSEALQAREIYQKPFTLINRAKFITNCNELPRDTENTEAYYRRFLIVPFDEKISEDEKDISIADKIISSELPGVFNWLLNGLERIIKQKAFTLCEKSEAILKEFRKQGDSVQLFIDERRYQPSRNQKEAVNEIYEKYKEFCHDDGYKPLGKNNFSKRLDSKGFERTRMNAGDSAFFINQRPQSGF